MIGNDAVDRMAPPLTNEYRHGCQEIVLLKAFQDYATAPAESNLERRQKVLN
jgi:hypothetical protein